MKRSSPMGFTQPTVVGANSMCRVGSCLQLCQSLLCSASKFLVPVHSLLIGFFPTVLGLITVFKIVFFFYCCCLFLFFFFFNRVWVFSHYLTSFSQFLYSRHLEHPVTHSPPIPPKPTPSKELCDERLGEWPASMVLLLVILYYCRHLSGELGHAATAGSEGACFPVPIKTKAWK